jgi:hypothetical protein
MGHSSLVFYMFIEIYPGQKRTNLSNTMDSQINPMFSQIKAAFSQINPMFPQIKAAFSQINPMFSQINPLFSQIRLTFWRMREPEAVKLVPMSRFSASY